LSFYSEKSPGKFPGETPDKIPRNISGKFVEEIPREFTLE
jgi:hypothetical protein